MTQLGPPRCKMLHCVRPFCPLSKPLSTLARLWYPFAALGLVLSVEGGLHESIAIATPAWAHLPS